MLVSWPTGATDLEAHSGEAAHRRAIRISLEFRRPDRHWEGGLDVRPARSAWWGGLMNKQNLKEGVWKQKVLGDLKLVAWISLYLVLFFCALSTYSMLMLHELNVTNSYFRYGFAIINALVLAKIIMIGEYARLGRGHEDKPLIISVVWKAFLFGLLVAAFHILEESVKRLAFHKQISFRVDEMLIRNLVVFTFLIPFFAFWELRRVLGEGKLFELFFRRRQSNSDVSIGAQKA
jgi:hypothetical protein